MVCCLCGDAGPWAPQMGLVRRWYQPHLERLYDDARVCLGDLEQLEQLAAASPSRERFLSDLTLDPPQATGAEAGPPHLDEDYLVLSTIHSAKRAGVGHGVRPQRRRRLHPVGRGNGHPAEIEEERRLLYVAMTRAKNALALVHPLRFYVRGQEVVGLFERVSPVGTTSGKTGEAGGAGGVRVDVAARLRANWAMPPRQDIANTS
jgi:DNA helicase-2/ATP-dependent DNA helicase PcrA